MSEYLGPSSANVFTGGRELDLTRGGAYCREEEEGNGENPESEEIPTLDGVVDDFERMCFEDMERFPVGSEPLSLKKGEATAEGAAAVIGKTGEDGRRGEAEAGDEEDEEEVEEDSEPDSTDSTDSCCGGCCGCWC